jgi:hypothetical protein
VHTLVTNEYGTKYDPRGYSVNEAVKVGIFKSLSINPAELFAFDEAGWPLEQKELS